METTELIKALRWIAANDEIVFSAEKATEAADALEELQAQLEAAEKCIYDVETYLSLTNIPYSILTIDRWREQKEKS